MKRCPECNTKLPNDTQFCYHCNASLDDHVSEAITMEQKRWWLLVLISIALIGLAFLLFSSSPGGYDPTTYEETETTEFIDYLLPPE